MSTLNSGAVAGFIVLAYSFRFDLQQFQTSQILIIFYGIIFKVVDQFLQTRIKMVDHQLKRLKTEMKLEYETDESNEHTEQPPPRAGQRCGKISKFALLK